MSDAASTPVLAVRRTPGDLVLGVLLVLAGIVILMHVVIATAVSVLFIGWTTLVAGVAGLVISVVGIGKEGFWTGLLGSGLLTVLGLVMVRNPGVAALTLTLVAGATFLAGGIVRLAAAVQLKEARVALVVSGGISTLLGLMVLFDILGATFTLLGVLLGVQVLSEGLSLMIAGRLRVVAPDRQAA